MAFADLAHRCDPSRAALVIVDVQRDFCTPRSQSAQQRDLRQTEQMVERLIDLIATARESAVPVVFIRTEHDRDSDTLAWRGRRGVVSDYESELCQPGTDGAEFFGVAPVAGEAVITKRRFDAFVGTDLDHLLRSMGRDAVIVTGLMTDICVETTVRHAVCLDYLTTIVSDCCEASTVERHDSAIERLSQGFGLSTTAHGIKTLWHRAEVRDHQPALSPA